MRASHKHGSPLSESPYDIAENWGIDESGNRVIDG
jgi:hypothetical protein